MITQCAPSSRRRPSLLALYGAHCSYSNESSTPIVSYINIEGLGQQMAVVDLLVLLYHHSPLSVTVYSPLSLRASDLVYW